MIRLDPLREALTRVKSVVDDHRPWRAGTAETGASAEGDLPKRMAGEITSRADVIGRLDHICQWYRSNEPSSPVPVMLERAKQMVSRDFLTLLMELAPDGASQFRSIADSGAPKRTKNDGGMNTDHGHQTRMADHGHQTRQHRPILAVEEHESCRNQAVRSSSAATGRPGSRSSTTSSFTGANARCSCLSSSG